MKMNKKPRKQTQILRILWEFGRKMGVNELSQKSGLSEMSVYGALKHLKRRSLIHKYRKIGKAGYKSPPKGTIQVQINDKVINRIKTILKNGRKY